MGDVITRFKLETTQYDSKLRDTSKALANYSRQAQMAGKDFNKVTQSQIETARALGNIAVSATNAKDKVKELVGAYNQVAKAYNDLTKDQQNSDYGKALSESLTTLQGRIRAAKAEMNDTGGVLGQLKDKFTINVDALKLFNAGLAAAQGALKVAKDAFFASEANVDEWGRTVQASQSVYEGFLNAINTGDISGYLSRIDAIVKAARDAYNELDRLGTMKTIQAPAMSAQQTENQRLRMMIQTGRYIAPLDGRRATMQNGQVLTPDQIKRIEQMLQGGMQKIITLTGNEIHQSSKAIEAIYRSQANDIGINLKEFRAGTSSMSELDKRMAGYDNYQRWRAEHTTIDQQSGREIVARGNPFAEYAKWGAFRVDGDRYAKLVQMIQQRDQQIASIYGMESQAYKAINRAEGITLNSIMGRGGSGGGGSENQPEYLDFYKALFKNEGKDLKAEAPFQSVYGMLKPEDMLGRHEDWEKYKDTITGTIGSIGESFKNLTTFTEGFDPHKQFMEQEAEKLNGLKKGWQAAATAINLAGNAMASLQNPAIDIMMVIGQAVATIGLAYAETLAKDKESKSNIYSFIAAAAAATISMATTIASLHNATGYAKGGIVEGTTYSNDQIPIMANAGEVVLTKAMSANLAGALQDQGGGGAGRIMGVVKGENMWLILNRYAKRSGKGELMTWRG